MFVFIIPSCVNSDLHFNQLKRCISSIRKFHENNKIILIDDSNQTFNIEDFFINDKNIFVKKSILKGSADQQVFKFFLEVDEDKAFIMQDSMILKKPLENIENIDKIKFLWHFTNHIFHWDIIKEPVNNYNLNNCITNHTDLIRNNLIKNYSEYPEFLHFALNCLNNKKEWCGCFGNCCIIDKQILIYMNNKIDFVNKFIKCNSNRDRRANESIFALICHYLFPEIIFYDSYDGLYYDGIHENIESGTPTGFDNIQWCRRSKYIDKVSFNR